MKIYSNTGDVRGSSGGTGGGNYQVDVSANAGLIQANSSINFNNTATINVASAPNGSGQVNVSFSVNTSILSNGGGSGTVTSIGTGIGLTGGPISTTGTISANIANTTVQGVTKLIDSISSVDVANAATANAVSWANSTAQTAITLAAAANVTGQTAFTLANTANNNAANANVTGQTAFTLANTANNNAANANVTAQTGITLAIAANTEAQSAYTQANLALNATAIYANGTLTLAKANINFNNTATVNVSSLANGTGQVNVAFSVNTSAIVGTGTVTNVATGIGLKGGPVTTTGTISANIANTTLQGVTLLIDSVSSNDTGNAATANSVEWTYNVANTANGIAQTALALAANAWTLANSDIVFANGVLGLQSGNLNFINTATINAAATANGTSQVNISFSVNTSAVGGGGGNYQADVLLGGNSILTNAKINLINTSTVNVTAVANGTTQANISFTVNTAATVGGANQQIQFNGGTGFSGCANLTYNITSNLMSAEANIRLANASSLIFGGQQSNTTSNSHFAMAYNAAANSIDITFLG